MLFFSPKYNVIFSFCHSSWSFIICLLFLFIHVFQQTLKKESKFWDLTNFYQFYQFLVYQFFILISLHDLIVVMASIDSCCSDNSAYVPYYCQDRMTYEWHYDFSQCKVHWWDTMTISIVCPSDGTLWQLALHALLMGHYYSQCWMLH